MVKPFGEAMATILAMSDPVIGQVPDIVQGTLSDGGKIELLLVIFESIWEVANDYKAPTVVVPNKGRS